MKKIDIAKKYHKKIEERAKQLFPDWDHLSYSDPLRLMAEFVSLAASDVESEINKLPQSIATQLPTLFGVQPHLARGSQSILQIETTDINHVKGDVSFASGMEFVSKSGLKFYSTESVTLFKNTEVTIVKTENACYLGFSEIHADSPIVMFVETEYPLASPTIFWSGYKNNTWKPMSVEDGTHSFQRSGMVKLFSSHFFEDKEELHGVKAYWVKIQSSSHSQEIPLKQVTLNAVPILNQWTLENHVLGSGKSIPNQELSLPKGEIVSKFKLKIYDEILGQMETWSPVQSFYLSSQKSNVFIYDPTRGVVIFGDGQRGRLCPAGYDNVFADRLDLCDGIQGNSLSSEVIEPFKSDWRVKSCKLLLPLTGGVDHSSQTELFPRFADLLKNKDRAVSLEDFQSLAIEGNPRVGKVFCYSDVHNQKVFVYPMLLPSYSVDKKALNYTPLSSDLEICDNYLSERKLLNTRLFVQSLKPRVFRVSCVLYLSADSSSGKEQLLEEIRNYFSVYSTKGSKIFPGCRLVKDHFHTYLESLSGMAYVRSLELEDVKYGTQFKSIDLEKDEIPQVELDILTEEVTS